ncbi:hypothetical protein [Pseudoxanthomonas sp.]|uniref:hypothetical protein n=1 Tax=Pseudoxanthomonas sp. TaxID=1871049 RepID=UPI002582D462|nr:hypothetical protein [Pseudoxanthomonas sp.]MCR6685479.1 hypothetical protein [Pseudoxanthomonas sp.]
MNNPIALALGATDLDPGKSRTLSPGFTGRIGERLSMAIGDQNLTDGYPDLSNEDIRSFGNLRYDVVSPVGSNGAYGYGRLRYTF